ncbi:MAG: hypothetical protein CL402_06255 [Acidiferrobacteraceae bacterium]|nr:hypothetical protein [Acidiferrobacteraceae bacterium]|tara:strand:- start:1134 stop:1736 length:603 start_codon:yes stop_codon:yes gene_type:complete
MKWILFLSLFLVSLIAAAGPHFKPDIVPLEMTSEAETAFFELIEGPDILMIRDYLDDCIKYLNYVAERERSDPVVIGMPCEPHEDSRVGQSIQEQGTETFKGRFLVLYVEDLRQEGDPESDAQKYYNATHAQMVTFIFDQPPFSIFSVMQAFLYSTPEEKNYEMASLWSFDRRDRELTFEDHKELVYRMQNYLFNPLFTL